MNKRTWVIVGATSIIAEHFAQIAAARGHHLRLVGRNKEQLELIASDIQLRYQVPCDPIVMDMMESPDQLVTILHSAARELDLFIGHSDFTENAGLNPQTITQLVTVNILATTQLIHAYLKREQKHYHLVYLSSVAACRGRAKNSLYGASKAAIEVYLQGLQQTAAANLLIVIARLGFIDTKQTYGLPGIFYAAPPKECATACWNALEKRKRSFFFPRFWQFIMAVITRLPFLAYKKVI